MGSKLIIIATIALVLGFVQGGRIHGPGRVKYGEIEQTHYPYLAFLSSIVSEEEVEGGLALDTYNCAGTVLNEHWILTAAHCTYFDNMTAFPKDDMTAFLNSNNNREGDQYQCDMMIPHPLYKGSAPPAYDNDIALIHFPDVLKVDYFVTLGPKDFDSDNIQASIIGWGEMENGDASPVLRKANINSVPKDQCPAIMYTYIYGGDKDGVRKTQICFPIEPTTAQQIGKGDSGGPLLWWDNNSNQDYYDGDSPIDYDNALVPSRKKRSYIDGQDPANLIQVGVVSNDETLLLKPNKKIYNLFTEVAQFRDWIDETMASYP